ncbi:8-amino-7-oxononanoate synthase [Candidatus Omnitrophota bacterium]
MHLVESQPMPKVKVDGRSVINLCSNNYLGLASDPRIKQAAIKAIEEYGVGSTASRLVCGNSTLHKELEERLARFKGTEAALVFSCGYMANLGIISSIVDRDALIFSDKLNHASIVDGIVLSRATLKRYPHKDMSALKRLLAQSLEQKKKLIVTDTVFSMDGDTAPLKEIVTLAKQHQGVVMIDEAHATGVFGPKGNGLAAELGISNQIDIHMGTLSKALGAHGAYVCASKDLINFLINFSRPFIYTTALPPAIAAASIKAIDIIEQEPELRNRLWENVKFIKDALSGLGFDTLENNSPIIPLIVGNADATMEFSTQLFNEGVFVQGIRPPTVAEGTSRLRVTVTAAHTREDLECALERIKKTAKKLCLI